jgi:hypothetical protein
VTPAGTIDVELVEVGLVARPGQSFSVGGEDDANDVLDRACGAVVAGNPFGGGQRDRAGLDRDVHLGVVELAGRVGEVSGDANRLLSRAGHGAEERYADKDLWAAMAEMHKRRDFLSLRAYVSSMVAQANSYPLPLL